MFKLIKRALTLLIAAAIMTNSFGVMAGTIPQNAEVEIDQWRSQKFEELDKAHQEMVIQELKSIGLSDKEISSIIKLEKQVAILSSDNKSEPLRTKIGDTKTKTINISKNTLTSVGSGGIAALLVRKGVPTAAAAMIAGGVIGLISDNVSFSSITITIKYVYGYNNDGVLAWNIGPVTWKVNY